MPIRDQLEALRIDRSRAPDRRIRPWIWLVAVVVVIAAIAVPGWMWLGGEGASAVRVVTVREQTAGVAGTVLNASGYVTARRQATVSSKITGKIVEVLIEEGMPVEKGQVLARLDDSLFRAGVELVESRLVATRRAVDETTSRRELAEISFGRAGRLLDQGVVGQAEFDEAKTQVDALMAREALERERVKVVERELALQLTELADTVIRAPYAGIVVSKDAQEGEMVSPVSAGGGFTRTGICTIVDMDSLEIEVDVNESYIARVEKGQPVEAVLDAYPDWRIPARVITTIPTADRQKATVQVRIGFERLDARILPDMGVKVAFQKAGPPEQAETRPRIYVPREAVRRDGDRDVVFVVRDDRAERRAVTLGALLGDRVEVVAGVGSGETLVVEGPEDLADGDAVSVP